MSHLEPEWKQIQDLFAQATTLPASQRETFIQAQCGEDTAIYREVVSLLKSHAGMDATQFPESPFEGRGDELVAMVQSVKEELGGVDSNREQPAASEKNFESLRILLEQVAPDFKIVREISHGGTGVVFQAQQLSLARRVAVKVLSVGHEDGRIRKRFIAEAKATARISHENVVDIFSVHDDQEISFFVMELLDGPSVKQYLDGHDSLAPRRAASIAQQLAAGLAAAHELELVHRDVKCANVIMIRDSGGDVSDRVKLIDFGIVRDLAAESVTLDQMIVGTPSYMSPEQLFSVDEVDHRSDVYGLGITLYEMLTGTQPFQGAPHMIMRQIDSREPLPLRKLDDRIPKDLESICLKAIHRSPALRYQTADEFREDLGRFLDGKSTIARPSTQLERLIGWSRRNQRLAMSMALSGLMLVALVLGSLGFALVVAAKNREITVQRADAQESKLSGLLDAEPGVLALTVEDLGPLDSDSIEFMRAAIESESNEPSRKFNAAVALAGSKKFQTGLVVDSIDQLYVSPDVCANVLLGLEGAPDAIEKLKASLESSVGLEERAQRIILLAHLGELEPWISAVRNDVDPSLRTALIHLFPRWHGDLDQFTSVMSPCLDEPWAWTICQSIMELDAKTLPQSRVAMLVRFLNKALDSEHYATFHFGQLAIRKFASQSLAEISWEHPTCRTFGDIHMIKIEPGETMVGRFDQASDVEEHPPRSVTFSRPFYLGETEISVAQFAEFLTDELGYDSIDVWKDEVQFSRTTSPTDEHPVNTVNWYEAVRFCNWLSEKYRLQPAYRMSSEKFAHPSQDGSSAEYDNWELNYEANGFRLPTDAEWEFAGRTHSQTPYFFGKDDRYLEQYGIGSSMRNISALPVRHLRPNSRGLYGMLGNVWEWTNDRIQPETGEALLDPVGPASYSLGQFGHVFQGGGINAAAGSLNSESRGWAAPVDRYNNIGFRVAMSVVDE